MKTLKATLCTSAGLIAFSALVFADCVIGRPGDPRRPDRRRLSLRRRRLRQRRELRLRHHPHQREQPKDQVRRHFVVGELSA